MLSRLNGHFMNVLVQFCTLHEDYILLRLLASVLSSHVRFQIFDSSYQLICVDGIIEGKVTEKLAS